MIAEMKNIYVTAHDIDFSRYIGDAFRYLVMNPDFHNATREEQKTAVCLVANGMCASNAVLRGWVHRDCTLYLIDIVTVADTAPTNDPDVCYVYHPATKQVY